MRVTALYGSLDDNDNGLGYVTTLVIGILKELGVEVKEIELRASQIPYYQGTRCAPVDEIIGNIKTSNGVIFAAPARLSAPSATLQTFLEHLELPQNNDAIKNKNCLLVTVSRNGGERTALDYLARVVNYFDGYDSTKIGLNSEHISKLKNDETYRLIIEKQVEDYYRILRQDRRFIIPRDNINIYYEMPEQLSLKSLTRSDYDKISETERKLKVPVSKIIDKLDLDAFAKKHEDDINELTKYFAQKHSQPEPAADVVIPKSIVFNEIPTQGSVTPRPKSVRQLTQSMPRYFQPQHTDGLNMCIQLTISGSETFEGYLSIQNTSCEYHDGQSPAPDITIIADAAVWGDVIKGKNTAQKAFMIGKLKVRGNFVMLAKLDLLFKPAV